MSSDTDAREDDDAGMYRRQLLAGVASMSAAALAGCAAPSQSASANTSNATETTTAETTDQPTTTITESHEPADLSISLHYHHRTESRRHGCSASVDVESWNDDRWLLVEVDNRKSPEENWIRMALNGFNEGQEEFDGSVKDREIQFYKDGERIVVATIDPETETFTTHLSGTVRIDDSEETCEVVEA